MLKKLIKYDILADYKKYAAVYIAMLASSVMMLFFDKMTSWISNNTFIEVMAVVFTMVFFALCLVAGVMILVLSTIRFYKNVMRDEGYLTHTLPVPTWQVIASKLITVYIWFFASLIVSVICGSIAAGTPMWIFHIFGGPNDEAFRKGVEAGFALSTDGAPFSSTDSAYEMVTSGFSLYAVYMLFSPLCAMAAVYFACALGNLFSRSKLAMSVLMYFLLAFAESIVGGSISVFITPQFVAEASKYGEDIPLELILNYLYEVMTASLIASIVLSIGFLIGAERIFAKKLNLE